MKDGKQICIKRIIFQASSTVNDTITTVEDPTHCELLNDFHVLPETFEKHCNTANSENADIVEIIDLFWELKSIFSSVATRDMR